MAALPLNFTDALPKDHDSWFFVRVVEEMGVAEFETAYRADGQGGQPYSPRSMVALLLYCYSKNLRSGRDIAEACVSDVGARMIMGNRLPERSTIDRFRTEHAERLMRLFAQTLRLGDVEGLVDVSVVAGDGTKVVANAAMSATVAEPALRAQIGDLEERLRQAQDQWEAVTGGDDGAGGSPADALFGPGADLDAGGEEVSGGFARAGSSQQVQVKAWRRVATLQGMLDKRRAALAHLGANPGSEVVDWQEKLARDQARVVRRQEHLDQTVDKLTAAAAHRQEIVEAGGKIPGRTPVPVQDSSLVRRARTALGTAVARARATAQDRPAGSRVNPTDLSSRIMPGKHDGYDQRYNLQALACRRQFILAVTLHDNPNDKQAMIDLLRAGRDNLDIAGILKRIGTALFDSGYASEANFTADIPVDLLLVAVEKEARQTGRLKDATSTAAAVWATMGERLAQPENKALYKQRAAMIEPLFAQMFARFGNDLHERGPKVLAEIFLWAITHNCLKIHRSRLAKAAGKT